MVGQAPLQSKEETARESSVCLVPPLRPALFTEGRWEEVRASTPLAQFCIQRKLSFVESLMQDLMSCDLLILEGICSLVAFVLGFYYRLTLPLDVVLGGPATVSLSLVSFIRL